MFEQAEGIYNLITRYGVERDEAAELLGLSEGQLMSKLRLLNFSALERERILGLGLSEGQAKALLRIPDEKTRERELVTKIPERAGRFFPRRENRRNGRENNNKYPASGGGKHKKGGHIGGFRKKRNRGRNRL